MNVHIKLYLCVFIGVHLNDNENGHIIVHINVPMDDNMNVPMNFHMNGHEWAYEYQPKGTPGAFRLVFIKILF